MSHVDERKTEHAAQHDARPASVHRRGPTAERHHSALGRYVAAVAADQLPSGAEVRSDVTFPPLTVADVMTRAVVSAYAGAAFKEIAAALDRNRINSVPVINDEHRVMGVVTTSDLLARVAHVRPVPRGHRRGAHGELSRKEQGLTAADLMTAPAITASTGTSIADAARQLARHRIRSMPVVDRAGALVGMVSRADLIRLFLRSDDEIRDDIVRDVVEPTARPGDVAVAVDGGIVRLSGHVPTALLARRLELQAANVAGVVDVRSDLTFEVDDRYAPRSS